VEQRQLLTQEQNSQDGREDRDQVVAQAGAIGPDDIHRHVEEKERQCGREQA